MRACNELGLDMVVPNYVSLSISPFIFSRHYGLYDFVVIIHYYYSATPRVGIIFSLLLLFNVRFVPVYHYPVEMGVIHLDEKNIV